MVVEATVVGRAVEGRVAAVWAAATKGVVAVEMMVVATAAVMVVVAMEVVTAVAATAAAAMVPHTLRCSRLHYSRW